MSPWFSRGRTALELARSRNVKVLFKQGDALVVKDPDQHLLQSQSPPTRQHEALISAIRQLRKARVTNLGHLLNILGSRFTSWARDMAIITGLFVDVPMESAFDSPNGMFQRDIYQKVFETTRTVKHGHYSTIHRPCQGMSWCPSNLFGMLVIATSGEYSGTYFANHKHRRFAGNAENDPTRKYTK